jgi:alpha-glucoside transport system substrate-binding protein
MLARRNFIVLVAFVMLGLIVAACGGGAAPTPQTIVVTSPPVVITQPPIVITQPPAAQPTAAPTKPPTGQSLTVAATWGGGEREAFLTVVDGFTQKTGIAVNYESIRQNMGGILRTRVAGGNPPDVAFEPRPGEVAEFAKAGNLVKLDNIVPRADLDKAFNKAYLDLGTVDGSLYGFVFKANSKSTFWYKPASFKALGATEPKTLDDLFAIADKYKAAGKVPFSTGGKDAWVLTDYFENLLIRVASAQTYNDLHVTHKVAWTDPSVKKALTLFAKFFQPGYQVGDVQGVLGTGFVDSIGQTFGPTPKAEMFYEGGFVGVIATTDVNKTLKPGDDINFFMFPQADAQFGTPVVGGGDVAIMFRDTPQSRAFMQYLVSKEAADIFATTNTISPNKQVDPSKFPSVLARNEYQQLANAQTFVFDGSDLAPAKIGGDVEFTKLQELVQKPADVDRIAQDIENAAKTAY